ncbi:MAG TPA: SDR family NAD(P)-dependent oxidoreductase [Paracoccaceae bacterium]
MIVEGQIALVTGAGSGLGAATARHLAGAGARVAVLDFDGARADAVAQEISGIAVQADVGDEPSVARAFDAARAAFGAAPRIVISCAGIASAARIVGREGKLSIDVFERTLRVNLLGTYIVMSHAARAMAVLEPLGPDGERGVIINTASVAYEDGQLGQAAYAASKGGVASLALPAAREFARSGIRVMVIAPGLFQTAMAETLPDEVRATIAATIPFPSRLGHAAEYAMLAEQIIRNPFLNGTTIRLDGGVRLPPR